MRVSPHSYKGTEYRAIDAHNSGAGAILLAVELGATEIILLGYDAGWSPDGARHWHGDHPDTLANAGVAHKWPGQFAALASRMPPGVTVRNASRRTAVTCWPRVDLGEVLAPVVIDGMMGLGDNIYQRAFVKNFPGAYLRTPWPELYKDLDVKCVKPSTGLRTQSKNVAQQAAWHSAPSTAKPLSINYSGQPIVAGMSAAFRRSPQAFDLPDFGQPPVVEPYVLVRPVTVREEWRSDARNPLPEYISKAAAAARARGYAVVSVADLADGKEWSVGELPVADHTFHRGELSVSQLMALTQHAGAIIGGIGWILPAAIAAKVPALIVCGGQGGLNAPELLTDPGMGLSRIEFLVPDNFCQCKLKRHACDKRISDYDDKLASWIDRLPAVV